MRVGWFIAAAVCLFVLHSQVAGAEIVRKSATHAILAKKNLEHSLQRAQHLSQGRPNDPVAAQAVVDLLLMRLQFYRNYADLDELATLCEPWRNDARAEAQYLCADVDAARHDFLSALERVARAGKRGGNCAANQKRISAIGATLEVDLAKALADTVVDEAPTSSYSSAVLAAAQATAQGDTAAAVEFYNQAVANYGDVSPYPIAWAWYQSAELLKGQSPQLAIDYYNEALEYLPDYIAPRVELAALQIDMGDESAALKNLNFAAQRSDDPDIHALISRALSASSAKASQPTSEESDRYLAKSLKGFDDLLERHPFAFADHAAEVYLFADKVKVEKLRAMLMNQKQRVAQVLKNWPDESCPRKAGTRTPQ